MSDESWTLPRKIKGHRRLVRLIWLLSLYGSITQMKVGDLDNTIPVIDISRICQEILEMTRDQPNHLRLLSSLLVETVLARLHQEHCLKSQVCLLLRTFQMDERPLPSDQVNNREPSNSPFSSVPDPPLRRSTRGRPRINYKESGNQVKNRKRKKPKPVITDEITGDESAETAVDRDHGMPEEAPESDSPRAPPEPAVPDPDTIDDQLLHDILPLIQSGRPRPVLESHTIREIGSGKLREGQTIQDRGSSSSTATRIPENEFPLTHEEYLLIYGGGIPRGDEPRPEPTVPAGNVPDNDDPHDDDHVNFSPEPAVPDTMDDQLPVHLQHDYRAPELPLSDTMGDQLPVYLQHDYRAPEQRGELRQRRPRKTLFKGKNRGRTSVKKTPLETVVTNRPRRGRDEILVDGATTIQVA